MNISEFERTKPEETHACFMKTKDKYETLLKETVIMDKEDAIKVEMTALFLKDLKEIYKKFLTGL
jgi:hypothetical protein|tara:strand:- start:386 stop:580 length:195 start_codon:yes stop_codon:yes gene_type:complete